MPTKTVKSLKNILVLHIKYQITSLNLLSAELGKEIMLILYGSMADAYCRYY